jgi:hypothetical protein
MLHLLLGEREAQGAARVDESGASALKEQFYGLEPLVGGCVWDEQFHTSAV